jgi:acetolactate synthase-1/2/3 large subunit
VTDATVARQVAAALARHGVRRMFGVPGGGSSLDLIEAGAELGIEFVLARTESAALMMAAATAELSGTPGVAITTKGPGTANGTNGFAYAAIDRAPLVLLTDGFTPAETAFVTHQVFDQQALLAPLAKGAGRLEGDDAADEFEALLQLAMTPPFGPVLVELTSEAAKRVVRAVTPGARSARHDAARPGATATLDVPAVDAARSLLAGARRPVMIVGLESRDAATAAAVRRLAGSLACPVLATYKAMGVMPDSHPQYVGGFTSGAAEFETVSRADLILLVGFDPVELLRQRWRYSAPVVDVAAVVHPVHYVEPAAGLYGAIAPVLDALAVGAGPGDWTRDELATLKRGMRAALRYESHGPGLSPQQVVEIVAEAAAQLPALPRIAVDAGAHMFSAMAFWPSAEPCDALISNGLATMAFALPAAIASALHHPERIAIAFTGDGGLFMCLAELSTAVLAGARVVTIVFNDGALSLIDIKQQQRRLPTRGVRWERPDFAAVMRGLGGRGYRVDDEVGYRRALTDAFAGEGPALIDVVVDPTGYTDQLKALRG